MTVSPSKPILLLDMGGVLVYHNHIDALNAEFGTAYTRDDIIEFTYSNLPPEHAEFMFAQWHRHDLYDSNELTLEQQDVIDGLREMCRVVVCTSPSAGSIKSKSDFLRQYFDKDDIVIASDKTLVRGDMLVDDAPHNIHSFPGHVIIYDQPYNKGIPGPRARTFEDLGPLVTDYLISQRWLDVVLD